MWTYIANPYTSVSAMQRGSHWPRRPKKKETKKPGAGTNKKVRVKNGTCVGAEKRPPPPTQKVPDAMRPRVPVTLWQTKYAVKIPKKGGVQSPRPRLGLPLGVTPPRGG